jgi:hypothetical protein
MNHSQCVVLKQQREGEVYVEFGEKMSDMINIFMAKTNDPSLLRYMGMGGYQNIWQGKGF